MIEATLLNSRFISLVVSFSKLFSLSIFPPSTLGGPEKLCGASHNPGRGDHRNGAAGYRLLLLPSVLLYLGKARLSLHTADQLDARQQQSDDNHLSTTPVRIAGMSAYSIHGPLALRGLP
jgi:hypothetical protein